MSENNPDRSPWFKEPFTAAWAFIVVFSVSMLVGISVLVGAASHEPRGAALLALGPAVSLPARPQSSGPLEEFSASSSHGADAGAPLGGQLLVTSRQVAAGINDEVMLAA